MLLLKKDQLDDELGWHDTEYYDLAGKLQYRARYYKQVSADIYTATWGYEPID